MATKEHGANTNIDEGSSGEEPTDERPRGEAHCARSLDSPSRIHRDIETEYEQTNTMSMKQKGLVDRDVRLLTAEQREYIANRQEREDLRDEGSEPEPPRNKGKGIDPRNWGDINFEPEELDNNLQEEMFDAYQEEHRQSRKRSRKDDRKTKHENAPVKKEPPKLITSVKNKEATPASHTLTLESRRASSRPVAQIVPESSLGVALSNIARLVREPEDPDDFSSSSSDVGSSRSRSARSDSRSGSRRRHRHRSSKKSSKRKSRRSSRRSRARSIIKPIPPKDYDGAQNPKAYHRFVMEGEAYLRDGKVSKERHIHILAHYLDGKAYSFYMQKVASDKPENWDLYKFFTELFNYCFPTDYRQKMRLKLEDLHQKANQPVIEFVYELQELFSMVGAMPAEMKVVKLWYSLNTRTQRALWRDGLHPDSSSWDEVVAKAEVIEIADGVINHRDPRDGPKHQSYRDKGWRNNADHDRRKNPDVESRSITYDRKNGSSSNGSKEQPRQTQPRQGSAQPSGKNGNSMSSSSSKPKGSWKKNGTPRKSVKFADLSEQEMAQLRAKGKCFCCKEVGHLSRNCPHRSLVPGNGSGKPPGIPSFSMEMDIIKDDDAGGDVLESMPVGYVAVDPVEVLVPGPPVDPGWRRWYPTWQNARALAGEHIGNCYEMTAEYLLDHFQPYPGDDLPSNPGKGCVPYGRFRIRQLTANREKFRIKDELTGVETIIDKSRLSNPKFNLTHWYAKNRARTLGLRNPRTEEYPPQLEDPIVLVTQHHLRNGVQSQFPNTKSDTWTESRFFVHLKDYGSSTYVITDDDLNLKLEIELLNLENPRFNLTEWYYKHARTEGMMYREYLSNHWKTYGHLTDITEEDLCHLVPCHCCPSNMHPDALMKDMVGLLEANAPFPGDNDEEHPIDPSYRLGDPRFEIEFLDVGDYNLIYVYDRVHGTESYLRWELANWEHFSLGKWYAEQCAINCGEEYYWEAAHEWMLTRNWEHSTLDGWRRLTSLSSSHLKNTDRAGDNDSDDGSSYELSDLFETSLAVYGVQVDRNKYVSVQRNASRVKGANDRVLPKPVVINFIVNGLPVRALIDSGSLGDFISSTLVDQLKLKRTILDKPLGLQLAVQGSRSKINASVSVDYSYQNIRDSWRFDVVNLNDYDVILGTPWMWQHRICIGLNPARIVVGSDSPLPINPGPDTKLLLSAVSLSQDEEVIKAREELVAYADLICRNVEETELPPLRAINHTIPLIDENKVYPWRPSRCPEVFRSQWNQKRDAYLKSGPVR